MLKERRIGTPHQRGQAGQRDDPKPPLIATQRRVHARQQEHPRLHHGGRVQVSADRRGRRHGVRQPEVERELRALGEGAEQHQHQGHREHGVRLQHIARSKHGIQLVAAHDVTDEQHTGQQAQAPGSRDGQRHARALPCIGPVVPVANQQEARQAGQLPEQHQQNQVVGQHHAQHGAHEEQQKAEEARRWVFGVEVPSPVQHHQSTDARDEQGKQPGQAINPKTKAQPELRQPLHAPAEHLAAKHGGRHVQQQAQPRQGHRACDPSGQPPAGERQQQERTQPRQ